MNIPIKSLIKYNLILLIFITLSLASAYYIILGFYDIAKPVIISSNTEINNKWKEIEFLEPIKINRKLNRHYIYLQLNKAFSKGLNMQTDDNNNSLLILNNNNNKADIEAVLIDKIGNKYDFKFEGIGSSLILGPKFEY